MFRRTKGLRGFSTLMDNFPLGANFTWWSNFAPRGEVKNWPLTPILKSRRTYIRTRAGKNISANTDK
jgi:hypothetical protein